MKPTAHELELMRITPALQTGLALALDKLDIDAVGIAELFYDVSPNGSLVDVYVKSHDGRTAIGSAIVSKARH